MSSEEEDEYAYMPRLSKKRAASMDASESSSPVHSPKKEKVEKTHRSRCSLGAKCTMYVTDMIKYRFIYTVSDRLRGTMLIIDETGSKICLINTTKCANKSVNGLYDVLLYDKKCYCAERE